MLAKIYSIATFPNSIATFPNPIGILNGGAEAAQLADEPQASPGHRDLAQLGSYLRSSQGLLYAKRLGIVLPQPPSLVRLVPKHMNFIA